MLKFIGIFSVVGLSLPLSYAKNT